MRIATIFLLCMVILGCSTDSGLKNGDIIFHESKSNQSSVLKELTGSRYTHCGIILVQNDEPYVFEAVEPVKLTPFQDWVDRGVDQHYVVKRLDRDLTTDELIAMQIEGRKFEGKHYDSQFMWSNSRIYCSELIWKIYKNGLGIELNSIEHMRDFDTSHESIQTLIDQRWNGTLPENEPVLTPIRLFEASQLRVVRVVN